MWGVSPLSGFLSFSLAILCLWILPDWMERWSQIWRKEKKKLYILSWCCLKLYLNCQVFWRGRLVSLALPLIGHPALPHPWPHSLLPWEMCSPANVSHLALFAALVVPTTPQFCLPWAHSVGKWQVVLGEALSRLLNPLSSLVPQLWSDNWGQSQEVFTFSIYSTI